MIRAGELNHFCTIQSATETRDTDGGAILTWGTFSTGWFQILPLSGREFIAAGQNNSEMTHTIRGHWKSGVTNKMRLVTGSRTFEVLAAMNWGERNEELRIMAKEIL